MISTHKTVTGPPLDSMRSTNNAITERYRCPEIFLEALPKNGDHCPDIRDIMGTWPAENQALAPFDPSNAVHDLRHERYEEAAKSLPGTLIRNLYYAARPLLPVSFRSQLQKLYLHGWEKISFPRWPLDVTVERLLEQSLVALMQASGRREIPFIWFWPDGANSAAIVTHDVETASGRDFCGALMDIDESFGIRSSFQLVPEGRYTLTPALLDAIRDRGHDVNVQDLNHDGRLFADRAEFEVRVKRINQYGRQFRAHGFRSAVLYRNPEWFDRLDFEYDMSLPNVGHLDAQRGGCCTVFPFFIGGLLEIPVTATQDYSLFHILHDYRLDLWKSQAAGVTARNGLLSFIIHPDYLSASRAQNTYCGLLRFLSRCRAEDGMWTTTPNQLNTWWRQRSQMTLVERAGSWQIEGPGRERASVAFARLKGGQISYVHDSKPSRTS